MTNYNEPMRFFIRSPRLGCVAQFRFAEDVLTYCTALNETDGAADAYDWSVYDHALLIGQICDVIHYTVSEISHGKAA